MSTVRCHMICQRHKHQHHVPESKYTYVRGLSRLISDGLGVAVEESATMLPGSCCTMLRFNNSHSDALLSAPGISCRLSSLQTKARNGSFA